MKKFERVKAVVSLDAIAHNFAEMKKNIAKGTKIVAVIKADGYGHGAEAIARLIEDYDYIWGFAVATPEEALQLRTFGVKKPILILGIVFEEYFTQMIAKEIRLTVCTYEMAQKLSEEAQRQGRDVHIHIGLDTGMSRIGFADRQESVEEIKKISQLPNLKIEGMFTHFARADETDRSPAIDQLNRYLNFAKLLEDAGIQIPMKHCSNSAGIIRVPEANLNAVRAGITIYGIYPSHEVERDIVKLIPAMELKSHISYIKTVEPGAAFSYGGTFTAKKEMKVATIPVGYADGYPRSLSNKGWVLIHGKKAPILGRVCMDQFMVDITKIPDAKTGDEVTLIGKDGKEFISIEKFGDLSGRFSYEFACDISKRVPRVYIKDGKEWGELTFFN
ncbi:alanine racemase [Blautia obeum]|jgi:alanine racemase|uniref:alanine racemase n=1 Tax=Blautia obeum TaxID=40520 RepID=UPI0015700054|nr:alanine racemase [Blautia obeum]NSG41301.1 alanine racemase [Blautia obeum]